MRSCRPNLAKPESRPKMLGEPKGPATDHVFLDIEDAVVPIAKADPRKNIVAALKEDGCESKTAPCVLATGRRWGHRLTWSK